MKNSELKKYIKEHLRKHLNESPLKEEKNCTTDKDCETGGPRARCIDGVCGHGDPKGKSTIDNRKKLNENLPTCCWDGAQNTTKSGCCFKETGMCICNENETGGHFSEHCCDDSNMMSNDGGKQRSDTTVYSNPGTGKTIKNIDRYKMMKEIHVSGLFPHWGHDTNLSDCLNNLWYQNYQAEQAISVTHYTCVNGCPQNQNYQSCVSQCNNAADQAMTQQAMSYNQSVMECNQQYNTPPTDTTGTSTGGGTTGGGSCFIAGTKVKMADGTDKNIEDVLIGEKVQGQNSINTVLDYDHPLLEEGREPILYGINNSGPFVTAEHPLMTTDGWKAVDSSETKRLKPRINYLNTTDLKVEDKLVTNNGDVIVSSIEEYKDVDPTQKVYNFILDGDHTYYANNILAHNRENVDKNPVLEPIDIGPIDTGGKIVKTPKGRGRRLPSVREAAKNMLNEEISCKCWAQNAYGGISEVMCNFQGGWVGPLYEPECCGNMTPAHWDDAPPTGCWTGNAIWDNIANPGGTNPIGIEPTLTHANPMTPKPTIDLDRGIRKGGYENIDRGEGEMDPKGKMTAGGPCYCVHYQTQPDGSNICKKWSPPGCGDAPFKMDDRGKMGCTPPAGGCPPGQVFDSVGCSCVDGEKWRYDGVREAATNMLEDEEFLLNEFFACDCGLYGGSGTEICMNASGGCSTCCANQMVAPTKDNVGRSDCQPPSWCKNWSMVLCSCLDKIPNMRRYER